MSTYIFRASNVMKSLCKRTATAIYGLIDREIETMATRTEVNINNYVVFMWHLSLAVRGLGYLVLTWTTVVLLGGYVSMLNVKDFWSLTVITLVQTVGVLDVSANERLSNIGYSFFGLLISMLPLKSEEMSDAAVAAVRIATIVQALVFILILCPLGAAYMFRLVISTGLSIWRLIQQDYVNALDKDPNKKNMRPALNVLYSLCLLQGGLFLYRATFSAKAKALTKFVTREYELDDKARRVITDYFRETRVGMEKDPSFLREWNLLTYAVGQLESRSPDKFLSVARLLDMLLPNLDNKKMDLAKKLLLGSPLAGCMVTKLLWTPDSYGEDEEAREHAATILEILAKELRLEQFPGGFRRIESLLDDSNNLNLKQKGLRILRALATDEHNRQAMRDMRSLFAKIVAALNIERHQSIGGNEDEHHTWDKIAWPALALLRHLMDSPGESGAKLHPRQGSSMAISADTMENIIKCNMCNGGNKEAAMKILQFLPGDEAEAITKNLIASNMTSDEVVVQVHQADIEEGGC